VKVAVVAGPGKTVETEQVLRVLLIMARFLLKYQTWDRKRLISRNLLERLLTP